MLQNQKAALPCVKMVDFDDILGIDLDQVAADVARFVVPFPCVIEEARLTITETCAGSTPGVVKMDKRPTAGSDTGRGDGDIGDFPMGTLAAGKSVLDLVSHGIALQPGEEVVVEITTAPVTGPAGHFEPILLVKVRDETVANQSNTVLAT